MNKTKKYLLLTAGALMIIWAIVIGYFVAKAMLDSKVLTTLANQLKGRFGKDTKQMVALLQYCVAYLAANAVLSLGFGLFAIRYSMFSPKEFHLKKTIIATMSVISVVVVNPILAALFIVASFMADTNYVPEEEADLKLNMLEDKLQKLLSLKEKGLISDEEFVELRTKLLSDN